MRDYLTYIVGGTVTAVTAVANVAYSVSMATGLIFGFSTAYLFAALGLALDIAQILATFAYKEADMVRKRLLIVIFVICSLFSIHSTYSFLKQNTSQLNASQSVADITAQQTKMVMQDLQNSTNRDYRDLERLKKEIKPTVPAPLAGFEMFLAFALWWIHSTIWYALLTPKKEAPPEETEAKAPLPTVPQPTPTKPTTKARKPMV